MSRIKFAFHLHTNYSKDSLLKPVAIINYCREKKIRAIAICDHNQIAGGYECKKIANGDPFVIIGEEIKTDEGEVIGLFLKKHIDSNQSLDKTIAMIKKQGGLVCIPHPGETFRKSALPKGSVIRIIKQVDIIEVYNSRSLFGCDDDWALKIAKDYKISAISGSDSHLLSEIKNCVMHIDSFSDKNTFMNSLKSSRSLVQKKTGLITQIISLLIRYFKKLSFLRL